MAIKERIYESLTRLDNEVFRSVAAGADAPSDADMRDYESLVGFQLPEEFRELTLSELGGLYTEVREDCWPRPEPFHTGPAWTLCYGIKILGISRSIPRWLDLRAQTQDAQDRGVLDFAPCLQTIYDSQLYGFDSEGVIWIDDNADELHRSSIQDLGELFDSELTRLQERQKEMAERLEHSH